MRLQTALALILGGAVGVLPSPTTASASDEPPTAPAEIVRYTFDTGPGGDELQVLQRNGGTLSVTGHDAGQAVAFPRSCLSAGCPRVIMEGGDDPRLDPGTRSFRYGASVRINRDQTGPGANVVQKGVATGGSQWKLQIDGYAGRPSCVLVGRNSPRWYVATSRISVADGAWHHVGCVRAGGSLTITVDGAEQGRVALAGGLVVASDAPLRIGGKGLGVNNDQYLGAVDDVYFTLL